MWYEVQVCRVNRAHSLPSRTSMAREMVVKHTMTKDTSGGREDLMSSWVVTKLSRSSNPKGKGNQPWDDLKRGNSRLREALGPRLF